VGRGLWPIAHCRSQPARAAVVAAAGGRAVREKDFLGRGLFGVGEPCDLLTQANNSWLGNETF